MDRVDSMQEQVSNVSRKMAALRTNKKVMLKKKKKNKTMTKIKNIFDELIGLPVMAKK